MDSFTCKKEIVLQIATEIATKKIGYGGESEAVIKYITGQPDSFGYESFMTRIPEFISGKLHAQSGAFVRPFMDRMLSYKRNRCLTIVEPDTTDTVV